MANSIGRPSAQGQGDGQLIDLLSSSPEALEVLWLLERSYLDPDYVCGWKMVSIHRIHNPVLEREAMRKKEEMQEKGYTSSEMTEMIGFTVAGKPMSYLRKVVQEGLLAQRTEYNALGDSSKGVYVSKHCDVMLKFAQCHKQKFIRIIVHKMIPGRLRRTKRNTDIVGPTLDYDGHISASEPKLSQSLDIQVMLSQMYIYEFNSDGGTSTRPRHCLPYAVVSYELNQDSMKVAVPQTLAADLGPSEQQGPSSQAAPSAVNVAATTAPPAVALATTTTSAVVDVAASTTTTVVPLAATSAPLFPSTSAGTVYMGNVSATASPISTNAVTYQGTSVTSAVRTSGGPLQASPYPVVHSAVSPSASSANSGGVRVQTLQQDNTGCSDQISNSAVQFRSILPGPSVHQTQGNIIASGFLPSAVTSGGSNAVETSDKGTTPGSSSSTTVTKAVLKIVTTQAICTRTVIQNFINAHINAGNPLPKYLQIIKNGTSEIAKVITTPAVSSPIMSNPAPYVVRIGSIPTNALSSTASGNKLVNILNSPSQSAPIHGQPVQPLSSTNLFTLGSGPANRQSQAKVYTRTPSPSTSLLRPSQGIQNHLQMAPVTRCPQPGVLNWTATANRTSTNTTYNVVTPLVITPTGTNEPISDNSVISQASDYSAMDMATSHGGSTTNSDCHGVTPIVITPIENYEEPSAVTIKNENYQEERRKQILSFSVDLTGDEPEPHNPSSSSAIQEQNGQCANAKEVNVVSREEDTPGTPVRSKQEDSKDLVGVGQENVPKTKQKETMGNVNGLGKSPSSATLSAASRSDSADGQTRLDENGSSVDKEVPELNLKISSVTSMSEGMKGFANSTQKTLTQKEAQKANMNKKPKRSSKHLSCQKGQDESDDSWQPVVSGSFIPSQSLVTDIGPELQLAAQSFAEMEELNLIYSGDDSSSRNGSTTSQSSQGGASRGNKKKRRGNRCIGPVRKKSKGKHLSASRSEDVHGHIRQVDIQELHKRLQKTKALPTMTSASTSSTNSESENTSATSSTHRSIDWRKAEKDPCYQPVVQLIDCMMQGEAVKEQPTSDSQSPLSNYTQWKGYIGKKRKLKTKQQIIPSWSPRKQQNISVKKSVTGRWHKHDQVPRLSHPSFSNNALGSSISFTTTTLPGSMSNLCAVSRASASSVVADIIDSLITSAVRVGKAKNKLEEEEGQSHIQSTNEDSDKISEQHHKGILATVMPDCQVNDNKSEDHSNSAPKTVKDVKTSNNKKGKLKSNPKKQNMTKRFGKRQATKAKISTEESSSGNESSDRSNRRKREKTERILPVRRGRSLTAFLNDSPSQASEEVRPVPYFDPQIPVVRNDPDYVERTMKKPEIPGILDEVTPETNVKKQESKTQPSADKTKEDKVDAKEDTTSSALGSKTNPIELVSEDQTFLAMLKARLKLAKTEDEAESLKATIAVFCKGRPKPDEGTADTQTNMKPDNTDISEEQPSLKSKIEVNLDDYDYDDDETPNQGSGLKEGDAKEGDNHDEKHSDKGDDSDDCMDQSFHDTQPDEGLVDLQEERWKILHELEDLEEEGEHIETTEQDKTGKQARSVRRCTTKKKAHRKSKSNLCEKQLGNINQATVPEETHSKDGGGTSLEVNDSLENYEEQRPNSPEHRSSPMEKKKHSRKRSRENDTCSSDSERYPPMRRSNSLSTGEKPCDRVGTESKGLACQNKKVLFTDSQVMLNMLASKNTSETPAKQRRNLFDGYQSGEANCSGSVSNVPTQWMQKLHNITKNCSNIVSNNVLKEILASTKLKGNIEKLVADCSVAPSDEKSSKPVGKESALKERNDAQNPEPDVNTTVNNTTDSDKNDNAAEKEANQMTARTSEVTDIYADPTSRSDSKNAKLSVKNKLNLQDYIARKEKQCPSTVKVDQEKADLNQDGAPEQILEKQIAANMKNDSVTAITSGLQKADLMKILQTVQMNDAARQEQGSTVAASPALPSTSTRDPRLTGGVNTNSAPQCATDNSGHSPEKRTPEMKAMFLEKNLARLQLTRLDTREKVNLLRKKLSKPSESSSGLQEELNKQKHRLTCLHIDEEIILKELDKTRENIKGRPNQPLPSDLLFPGEVKSLVTEQRVPLMLLEKLLSSSFKTLLTLKRDYEATKRECRKTNVLEANKMRKLQQNLLFLKEERHKHLSSLCLVDNMSAKLREMFLTMQWYKKIRIDFAQDYRHSPNPCTEDRLKHINERIEELDKHIKIASRIQNISLEAIGFHVPKVNAPIQQMPKGNPSQPNAVMQQTSGISSEDAGKGIPPWLEKRRSLPSGSNVTSVNTGSQHQRTAMERQTEEENRRSTNEPSGTGPAPISCDSSEGKEVDQPKTNNVLKESRDKQVHKIPSSNNENRAPENVDRTEGQIDEEVNDTVAGGPLPSRRLSTSSEPGRCATITTGGSLQVHIDNELHGQSEASPEALREDNKAITEPTEGTNGGNDSASINVPNKNLNSCRNRTKPGGISADSKERRATNTNDKSSFAKNYSTDEGVELQEVLKIPSSEQLESGSQQLGKDQKSESYSSMPGVHNRLFEQKLQGQEEGEPEKGKRNEVTVETVPNMEVHSGTFAKESTSLVCREIDNTESIEKQEENIDLQQAEDQVFDSSNSESATKDKYTKHFSQFTTTVDTTSKTEAKRRNSVKDIKIICDGNDEANTKSVQEIAEARVDVGNESPGELTLSKLEKTRISVEQEARLGKELDEQLAEMSSLTAHRQEILKRVLQRKRELMSQQLPQPVECATEAGDDLVTVASVSATREADSFEESKQHFREKIAPFYKETLSGENQKLSKHDDLVVERGTLETEAKDQNVIEKSSEEDLFQERPEEVIKPLEIEHKRRRRKKSHGESLEEEGISPSKRALGKHRRKSHKRLKRKSSKSHERDEGEVIRRSKHRRSEQKAHKKHEIKHAEKLEHHLEEFEEEEGEGTETMSDAGLPKRSGVDKFLDSVAALAASRKNHSVIDLSDDTNITFGGDTEVMPDSATQEPLPYIAQTMPDSAIPKPHSHTAQATPDAAKGDPLPCTAPRPPPNWYRSKKELKREFVSATTSAPVSNLEGVLQQDSVHPPWRCKSSTGDSKHFIVSSNDSEKSTVDKLPETADGKQEVLASIDEDIQEIPPWIARESKMWQGQQTLDLSKLSPPGQTAERILKEGTVSAITTSHLEPIEISDDDDISSAVGSIHKNEPRDCTLTENYKPQTSPWKDDIEQYSFAEKRPTPMDDVEHGMVAWPGDRSSCSAERTVKNVSSSDRTSPVPREEERSRSRSSDHSRYSGSSRPSGRKRSYSRSPDSKHRETFRDKYSSRRPLSSSRLRRSHSRSPKRRHRSPSPDRRYSSYSSRSSSRVTDYHSRSYKSYRESSRYHSESRRYVRDSRSTRSDDSRRRSNERYDAESRSHGYYSNSSKQRDLEHDGHHSRTRSSDKDRSSISIPDDVAFGETILQQIDTLLNVSSEAGEVNQKQTSKKHWQLLF